MNRPTFSEKSMITSEVEETDGTTTTYFQTFMDLLKQYWSKLITITNQNLIIDYFHKDRYNITKWFELIKQSQVISYLQKINLEGQDIDLILSNQSSHEQFKDALVFTSVVLSYSNNLLEVLKEPLQLEKISTEMKPFYQVVETVSKAISMFQALMPWSFSVCLIQLDSQMDKLKAAIENMSFNFDDQQLAELELSQTLVVSDVDILCCVLGLQTKFSQFAKHVSVDMWLHDLQRNQVVNWLERNSEGESLPQADRNSEGESLPQADRNIEGESLPQADCNSEGESLPQADRNSEGESLPQADRNSEGESLPQADRNSEGESLPQADRNSEGESLPQADRNSEGESLPQADRNSEWESLPQADRNSEGESLPQADRNSEGESLPQADRNSEGESLPQADCNSEGESLPQADRNSEGESLPQADRSSEGESLPQADCEAMSSANTLRKKLLLLGFTSWKAASIAENISEDWINHQSALEVATTHILDMFQCHPVLTVASGFPYTSTLTDALFDQTVEHLTRTPKHAQERAINKSKRPAVIVYNITEVTLQKFSGLNLFDDINSWRTTVKYCQNGYEGLMPDNFSDFHIVTGPVCSNTGDVKES
ncbi:uncharacterized protein LOC131950223 [Physella acuta]|uniref:uncharacterized protein LOC131950223 n=1 Tax=Physella acuta TaxID=109671 RepID=UPI0027DB8158|nr:uncharacterized protein LOC131950223 [Physella acuta]